MALIPQQSGREPVGTYDALDTDLPNILGGEVAQLRYVALTFPDLYAPDGDDGYVGVWPAATRPLVTVQLVSGRRPLFLTDDGLAGYGTLYGSVVGGTAGQVIQGAQLGPHSGLGSGKCTLWDKMGLYGVTLDAVDTTPVTGLTPTNPTLVGGAPLYATATGQITPNVGVAFEVVVVARLVEFTTNGSLVNTPSNLVSALNSPSGTTGTVLWPFTQAVIHFNPEI
jgi:hypothetical protein